MKNNSIECSKIISKQSNTLSKGSRTFQIKTQNSSSKQKIFPKNSWLSTIKKKTSFRITSKSSNIWNGKFIPCIQTQSLLAKTSSSKIQYTNPRAIILLKSTRLQSTKLSTCQFMNITVSPLTLESTLVKLSETEKRKKVGRYQKRTQKANQNKSINQDPCQNWIYSAWTSTWKAILNWIQL